MKLRHKHKISTQIVVNIKLHGFKDTLTLIFSSTVIIWYRLSNTSFQS